MPILGWLSKLQIPERQDTLCFVSPAPGFRLRSLLDPGADVTAVLTAKPTALLGELFEEIIPKIFGLPCFY